MVVDRHDTPSSSLIPDGGVLRVQMAPPSSVTSTLEESSVLSCPTATQLAVLADPLGAQETSRTLTSGEKVAVVCHPVVEAPAADRPKATPVGPHIKRLSTRATIAKAG